MSTSIDAWLLASTTPHCLTIVAGPNNEIKQHIVQKIQEYWINASGLTVAILHIPDSNCADSDIYLLLKKLEQILTQEVETATSSISESNKSSISSSSRSCNNTETQSTRLSTSSSNCILRDNNSFTSSITTSLTAEIISAEKLMKSVIKSAETLKKRFSIVPMVLINARYFFQPISSIFPRNRRRHYAAEKEFIDLFRSAASSFIPIIATEPFEFDTAESRKDGDQFQILISRVPPSKTKISQPRSSFFQIERNLVAFGNTPPEFGQKNRVIITQKNCKNNVEACIIEHVLKNNKLKQFQLIDKPKKIERELEKIDDPFSIYRCLLPSNEQLSLPSIATLLKHLTMTPIDAERSLSLRKKTPATLYTEIAQALIHKLPHTLATHDVFEYALKNKRLWHALKHGISSPDANICERVTSVRVLFMLVEIHRLPRKMFWQECGGTRWLLGTILALNNLGIVLRETVNWENVVECGVLKERIAIYYASGVLLALFADLLSNDVTSFRKDGTVLELKSRLIASVFEAIRECHKIEIPQCLEDSKKPSKISTACLNHIEFLPKILGKEPQREEDWDSLLDVAKTFPNQLVRSSAQRILLRIQSARQNPLGSHLGQYMGVLFY